MDFLDDTLCKMSKGFECLKSTANMGLGFCCSVGEAALNRGKNWRRSGKARTSLCLFRSLFTFHFSLDLSFHFFSLRPLSYAVFIQIIFTQSCFNLCWQYCVRVTQDKLWSCELHGNWIQVQTVRRREEDAHKSTKWDQWKCQKTQIEVPVCVQTELSKD